MTKSREQSIQIFKTGVSAAVKKANQSGFVATARFTFLADMIQIQCLLAENQDKLNFLLPIALHSTVKDLAAHNGAQISAYKTKSEEYFALQFESEDDQDEFIQFFELILLRGARAYPAPDLFLGLPNVDKELCKETLEFLHGVVQNQYKSGWNNIR